MLKWAQHGDGCVSGLRLTLVLTAVFLLAAVPAWSEDSDLTRYYFGLRFGEITPGLIKAHDVAGASIGVNLGKHIGFELSLDSYEVKAGEVAEVSVLGLVPQARLRYPLFHDRLVPYLIGGVGLAVTQANDGRASVDWSGGKDAAFVMGSVGGGTEYFIADNLAVGLEGKYLISGTVDYTSGGTADSVNISSGLVTLGFRVFYPELHPAENAESIAAATARFYLAVRTGGALLVHLEPFDGVHASTEQSLFGSNFTQQFGVSVGADIGRYASVELALDNYELKLNLPDVGGIGEYAVFPVAVQGKLRAPMLAERWEPYLLGGVGGEYAQLNDRTAAGNELVLNAKDISVMGVLGAGLEYSLMSNVAIGGQAKYIISRGHTFQIEGGPKLPGNFDSFMLSVAVRVFFFNV